MAKFEVIPAIDIMGGRCVRLHQGKFDEVTIYDYSPALAAENFEKLGATRLHVVDLDGAKTGKSPKFDDVWIVTNGRFSERALQFGVCRGMHLVGWGAEEHSLARLVDHATLYPITIVDDLRSWELENFSKKSLMLCREIAGRDPQELADEAKIDGDRAKKIINSCRDVIALD